MARYATPTATTDPAAAVFAQPQRLNLTVYRGDSGRFRVTVTDADGVPVNVSGAAWDCDIRPAVDGTLLAALAVTPVAGDTASVDVTVTSAISSTLVGPAVWDLQMTLGGEVHTLLAGAVTVVKDVSQP